MHEIRPVRSFGERQDAVVAERWVGSCRRDLLDHIIAVDERHLKRLLSDYIRYYHEDRTHLGLGKRTPNGRTRTIASGHVLSHVRLGGAAPPVRSGCLIRGNVASRKRPGSSILIYTGTPRGRFLERILSLGGEGITWMRQPSRQGIALFSVRIEFLARHTGSRFHHCWSRTS
jgi:hypothetical protein